MERRATARWNGDLKSGDGIIRVGSGAFEGRYSAGTRFASDAGTNPEELLGAAHAACFSMALSLALSTAGHNPTSIETEAKVHLEKGADGFSITRIDLVTTGVVAGIAGEEFERVANEVRTGCIVSRALAAVPSTVTATLKS